ncbi:hypothetical protein FQR65_LT16834 [Abscondita terminalis]|nr:hypothetical protein FQR65_LT16834 [Abscondita terminalis]
MSYRSSVQPGCRVVAKGLQWFKRRHTIILTTTNDEATAPAKDSPDADNKKKGKRRATRSSSVALDAATTSAEASPDGEGVSLPEGAPKVAISSKGNKSKGKAKAKPAETIPEEEDTCDGDTNKVSKAATSFVLQQVGKYEDILVNLMLENARFKGELATRNKAPLTYAEAARPAQVPLARKAVKVVRPSGSNLVREDDENRARPTVTAKTVPKPRIKHECFVSGQNLSPEEVKKKLLTKVRSVLRDLCVSTLRAAVKRTVYSDADSHKLVEIIQKYSHIVESKKTDSMSWKEEDAAWIKIADEFNCGVVEVRTAEQLRNKFDNLKKETRRFFVKQRQDLYRTGVEDQVRAILKALYEKIRCIINLSVLGLEAQHGDSDSIGNFSTTPIECEKTHEEVREEIPGCSTSTTVNLVQQDNSENIEPTPNTDTSNMNDWSNYSPAMLKSKKNKLLRVECGKTKEEPSQTTKALQGIASAKKELAVLKKELLLKENLRNEEFHKEKLRGQQLINENYALKNEILKLKLKKLQQNC